MSYVSIEEVWARVVAHEGETFTQMRGGEFTYSIRGDTAHLSRTNQGVARTTFERALKLVPLKDTTPLQHLRAPSYLFAILTDERIRGDDW
jgi:hypothetical protein